MHDRTLLTVAARLERMAEDRPAALRAALIDTAATIRRTVLEMGREAALMARAQAGPAATVTGTPHTPDDDPGPAMVRAVSAFLASDDGRGLVSGILAEMRLDHQAKDAAREETRDILRTALDTIKDREF